MAKISCTCEAAYLQGTLEALDMDSFKEELGFLVGCNSAKFFIHLNEGK